MTLPPVGDLISGSVSISDLREVDISDLLGREPVAPNEELLHRIVTAKSVMITGAGGSIGSELCRQVSKLAPEKLILAEMTEHALYLIEAELREAYKHTVKQQRYAEASQAALEVGLGLNAGHDLNRDNLPAFVKAVPGLQEVSIGHALIGDALELGYAATVQAYQACLQK